MGLLDFFKKGAEKPAESPKTASATDAETEARQEIYIVKSGDSLSKIAKVRFGDAQLWKKIHEANKDTIANPNLIHPGQKIIIPKI
jgi:nucleoid-associated protein YgaU